MQHICGTPPHKYMPFVVAILQNEDVIRWRYLIEGQKPIAILSIFSTMQRIRKILLPKEVFEIDNLISFSQ